MTSTPRWCRTSLTLTLAPSHALALTLALTLAIVFALALDNALASARQRRRNFYFSDSNGSISGGSTVAIASLQACDVHKQS